MISEPDLLHIQAGILKTPSNVPVLGPVSTSANPLDASPPYSVPSTMQRLYRMSLNFISSSVCDPLPTVSTLGRRTSSTVRYTSIVSADRFRSGSCKVTVTGVPNLNTPDGDDTDTVPLLGAISVSVDDSDCGTVEPTRARSGYVIVMLSSCVIEPSVINLTLFPVGVILDAKSGSSMFSWFAAANSSVPSNMPEFCVVSSSSSLYRALFTLLFSRTPNEKTSTVIGNTDCIGGCGAEDARSPNKPVSNRIPSPRSVSNTTYTAPDFDDIFETASGWIYTRLCAEPRLSAIKRGESSDRSPKYRDMEASLIILPAESRAISMDRAST